MLLLGVVVLALTGDLHAQRIAIEPKRRLGVVDDNGGVVDAEE
jgi:hypothetical protein